MGNASRLSLGLLIYALCLYHVNAGPKTYVIVSSDDIKQSHSTFFSQLEARGHELTISHVYDDESRLGKFGEFSYDNLIIFAPNVEDFGDNINVDTIVEFIDSGRNALIVGDENVTEPLRDIVNECGIDFDEEETQVIDHMSYDRSSQNEYHTRIAVENPAVDSAIYLGKGLSAPILFRGIGHATGKESRLITPILTGSQTTYSHVPGEPVDDYPQTVGSDTLLVTAVQARNNARVVIAGSLDMFSNEYFMASVTIGSGDNEKKYPRSGNQEFCRELSIWNFQERGLLRASKLQHKKKGSKESNPSSYRVKDEIEFSIVIEEYDGSQQKWVPYVTKDLQLEFRMLDPYIRTKLKHKGGGLYTKKFMVPDVYGVFKFQIGYHKLGYGNLDIEQQVSVLPYRHNQFERFINVAYPYYASCFGNFVAFFLLGIVFLYGDHSKK